MTPLRRRWVVSASALVAVTFAAVVLAVQAGDDDRAPDRARFCAAVEALAAATLDDPVVRPDEMRASVRAIVDEATAAARDAPDDAVAAARRYRDAIAEVDRQLGEVAYDPRFVVPIDYQAATAAYADAARAFDRVARTHC